MKSHNISPCSGGMEHARAARLKSPEKRAVKPSPSGGGGYDAACLPGHRRLPAWLKKKLAHPPKAGGGVHQWLFTMSLQLHRHLTGAQIEEVLAAAVSGCGRLVGAREISDAVSASAKEPKQGGRPVPRSCHGGVGDGRAGPRAPKWPPVDGALRSKVIAGSPLSLTELAVRSPLEIHNDVHNANWFLGELFEDEHLICMGLSQRRFVTRLVAEFLAVKLESSCLIVPSPMSAKYGVTQQGRRSEHTRSNTGQRRYLITEFDSGTADEQAAVINHLREFAPLVMVLSSGGKSLHAWWNCAGGTGHEHLRFFRYAVSLGADPATWTRSQFVRMPQIRRAERNAWQRVYYFDPANLPNSTVEGRAQ